MFGEDGKYYIQLDGETLEPALAGHCYDSLREAQIDAGDELPYGALFSVLDGNCFNRVVYSGAAVKQTHLHLVS